MYNLPNENDYVCLQDDWCYIFAINGSEGGSSFKGFLGTEEKFAGTIGDAGYADEMFCTSTGNARSPRLPALHPQNRQTPAQTTPNFGTKTKENGPAIITSRDLQGRSKRSARKDGRRERESTTFVKKPVSVSAWECVTIWNHPGETTP